MGETGGCLNEVNSDADDEFVLRGFSLITVKYMYTCLLPGMMCVYCTCTVSSGIWARKIDY